MNKIWWVAKKELDLYFLSPIAYIVLFVLALISGYYFYIFVFQVKDAVVIMPYLFSVLASIFLFISPFYTMRLISEEKKTGTIELLMTSPISEGEIVVGKFLGSFLFFSLLLSVTFLYLLVLVIWGHPDFGVILANYIGFFLLGATFISLGLVASSLTKNQIIAAILTFLFLLLFWLIGWIGSSFSSGLKGFFSYFSLIDHFANFNRGIIDSSDLIFFLSLITFNLFLTSRILSRKL